MGSDSPGVGTARGDQDVAVYECHCGASITFPERKWSALVYMHNKLGFRNIDRFLSHNRDCCECPQYTSLEGYSKPQEDSQP